VLTIGSPVVTPEGLVGSVSGYAGGLVEVRSLWDRDCRVAAIDRRSRVAGIVERVAGPHLRFSYVPADGDVAEGDTIVSSGWGERYPEGLPIGEVHTVAIDSASFFLAVIVKPFVRFETLEDVFVVQSAGGY
jgi:rod shape-determining protein MreC